jgi:hypothetical protein
VAYIPTNPADGIEWVKPSPQWGTPLYTAPPQTQAAVSAALRTAAEVLEVGEYDVVKETYCGNVYEDATATINELQKAILALPQDDSALRELCLRVAEEVNYSEGECTTAELQDIVGRVLNT